MEMRTGSGAEEGRCSGGRETSQEATGRVLWRDDNRALKCTVKK